VSCLLTRAIARVIGLLTHLQEHILHSTHRFPSSNTKTSQIPIAWRAPSDSSSSSANARVSRSMVAQ
jgi:hypothetical protein